MVSKTSLFRALGAADVPLLPRADTFLADAWRTKQAVAVRERAIAYQDSPTPPLTYQLFRLYWETGDRSAFQAAYYERRGRLLTFSLMVLLAPTEGKWLLALEDILWEICAEPFWCLPAHFLGVDDMPLPFDDYAEQLDLFSCETGFAIAECLALHERRLAPDVVRQADLQLEKRIFTPFQKSGTFYRFEGMENNWSGVCGSAIGGAALHRLRDRARLAAMLHRCLSCLGVYIGSFGDDGVCVEGVGYWTYGFGFYACFADLLERRTGGAIDLLSGEKVRAIALCQQRYYLTGAHTISFADGDTQAGFRMGLSCFLQRKFPTVALPKACCASPVLEDGCYRFCLALRDFLWTDSDAQFGLPSENGAWLPDAQWFLSRSDTLVLAAKAGNNGESHNHNDCGSLILCKGGEPILCDFGAGLYDAAYFGASRYNIFVNASRSHSVPLVDGAEQIAGESAAAREISADLGAHEDTLTMELSACYPVPALTGLRRVILHQKAACRICVTDTFSFSAPRTVTEVFVSCTPIRLIAGGAEFVGEKAVLRLSYDATRLTPALQEEVYLDHFGKAKTAFLLHLTSRVPQTKFCCAIAFE